MKWLKIDPVFSTICHIEKSSLMRFSFVSAEKSLMCHNQGRGAPSRIAIKVCFVTLKFLENILRTEFGKNCNSMSDNFDAIID